MNLSKIAETRVSKRRKERMLKVDFRQHRVVVHLRFLKVQVLNADKPSQCRGNLPSLWRYKDSFPAGDLIVKCGGGTVRKRVGDNREGPGNIIGAAIDLNRFSTRFLESTLQKVERLMRIFLG